MKKHLYNSKLSKVKWFVERFGWKEVALKPIRTIFAPLIIPALPEKSFQYQGAELKYLYHRYNMTWASERCVEAPIGRHWVERFPAASVLEVGNVLSHYGPIHHAVLDKFEKGAGVINEDIVDFRPPQKFQLIISISTFEHIGFDDASDGSSSGDKIQAAIQSCRALLTPDGRLVITVPINYNPAMDELIRGDRLQTVARTFMIRRGYTEWAETDQAEAIEARYKQPFPYANAVMIGQFAAA